MFIEAWSNIKGTLLPSFTADGWPIDPLRLAHQIPGVLIGDGKVDVHSEEVLAASQVNENVEDFVHRTHHFLASLGEVIVSDTHEHIRNLSKNMLQCITQRVLEFSTSGSDVIVE